MAHHDPYKNFRFRVKLDGRTVAGFGDAEVHASLTKVTGLGKSADITLKRGVMAAQSVWKWLGGVSCNDPASRKNIELVLVDEAGARLASWNVTAARPIKFHAPDLDASANEIAIESLEIANEGLALVDDDDPPKHHKS